MLAKKLDEARGLRALCCNGCLRLLGRCLLCLPAAFLWTGCTVSKPAGPYPDIEQSRDTALQSGLEQIVESLDLKEAADQHHLSISLVDITDAHAPRVAGVNAEEMMYAASLPKIAILFGLLKRIENGTLTWNSHINDLAFEMIRCSSNTAATELFHLVGPDYIARLLTSPEYRLYQKDQGGGLWVGKAYGGGAAWRREPLQQLSHAASAMSVAKFYYLLDTDRLVSPVETDMMKRILSKSALHHKFVRGLERRVAAAQIYRKSGSWGTFHSDSALIEHDGRKYIAVALFNDPRGLYWLEDLIEKMDVLIMSLPPGGSRSA